MKRKLTAGQTAVSLPIFVQDTSSTTGGGLSGLTSGTSGLVAEYRRRGQSSWTAITLTSKTLGTWTSGGLVADGALGGAYELDLPDAVCASGARWVAVRLRGAANMLPCLIEIELDAFDYQTATQSVNVTQFGGSAGTFASGRPEVNTTHVAGTSQTARDLGANIDTTISSRLATASYTAAPSAAANASAVRTELSTELGRIDAAISSRLASASYTSPPTAAVIADAVWDEARTGHTTSGTFGFYLDAAVSSVSSSGGLTTAQDTTLSNIYAFTSQITGSRIASVGPVKPGGDIELIIGKDYLVAADSALSIPVADTGGALYDDFTSATLAASKAFGAARDNGDAVIAGTIASVSYAANVTTFVVEIPASQLPDTLDIADDWKYQIHRVTNAGKEVVGVQGRLETTIRTV